MRKIQAYAVVHSLPFYLYENGSIFSGCVHVHSTLHSLLMFTFRAFDILKRVNDFWGLKGRKVAEGQRPREVTHTQTQTRARTQNPHTHISWNARKSPLRSFFLRTAPQTGWCLLTHRLSSSVFPFFSFQLAGPFSYWYFHLNLFMEIIYLSAFD